MSNPEHNTQEESNTAVNSQVVDSIKEINKLLTEEGKDINALGNKVLTQAASMAMLNIVNQQQQLYMLQNTVTTVAAKAMLESSPLEAVQLMNETVKNNSVMDSIKELKNLINELN